MVWYSDLYKSKNCKKFGLYTNDSSYFMKKSYTTTNCFVNTTITKSADCDNIIIVRELHLR